MSSQRIIDLRKKRAGSFGRAVLQLPGGIRDRRSPLRAKRRRTRATQALTVLAVSGAIAYGVHYVSYLPRFTISTISVAGAQYIQEESVRAAVVREFEDGSFHFVARNNIFLYPRATIERTLEDSFPRIDTARITRASFFSTAITVTIIEREPYAHWCAGSGECYLMDQTGYIFASASGDPTPSTRYVFLGNIDAAPSPIGKTFRAGQLPGMLALLKQLQEDEYVPLGAQIVDEQDYIVPLEVGYYIKVTHGSNPDILVRNLDLIVSSDALRKQLADLEYIDLRFGNRVYYKLKGAEEVRVE